MRVPWVLLTSLVLGVALLLIAFRGVDWAQLLNIMTRARWGYLILGFCWASCVSLLRGIRWRILLKPQFKVSESQMRISVLTVYWSMMIGYLGNNVLPARAGEIIRSVVLAQRLQMSSSFVLATALTERITDAAALVTIGLVSFLWLPDIPRAVIEAVKPVAFVTAIGFFGLLALPHLQRQLLWFVGRFPLPEKWLARAMDLINQFLLGMRSLQHPSRGFAFVVLTAVIWIGDAITTMIVAASLKLSFILPLALLLNVSLGLSSAIPATPGYVGVYQAVAVMVLTPFGFERAEALAYIIVFQLFGYSLLLVWGLLGLWKLDARSYLVRKPPL